MKKDQFTQKQKNYFAWMVNIIVPLAGISTDIYLPSLPAMALHFHTTKALTQLTVTAFMFAIGIGQLLAGPISDAYGRKPLLLMSLFMQFLSVVGILLSPSISWVITFRCLQGIAAAFMMVPVRAVLNDVFEGRELRKQFNYTTISFALGPIIAPFIGGYLQGYFSWEANFYFIVIYLLILIASLLVFYHETIPEKRLFSLPDLWKNYLVISKNRYFIVVGIFVGIFWGYSILFNLVAPFLVQTVMHHSAVVYGYVALSMGVAWFAGNTLNRFLFEVKTRYKAVVALWGSLLAAIALLLLAYAGYFDIPTLLIPAGIMILLSGCMFPIYVAECLTIFPKIPASANAYLFALIWLIIGVFTATATLLKVQSLLPIAVTYTVVSVICLVLYYGIILPFERVMQID